MSTADFFRSRLAWALPKSCTRLVSSRSAPARMSVGSTASQSASMRINGCGSPQQLAHPGRALRRFGAEPVRGDRGGASAQLDADGGRGLRARQLHRHEGWRRGDAAHFGEQPAAAATATRT